MNLNSENVQLNVKKRIRNPKRNKEKPIERIEDLVSACCTKNKNV
jgi:hypothetical protein